MKILTLQDRNFITSRSIVLVVGEASQALTLKGNNILYRRIPQSRPHPLCMVAWAKARRRLISGILTFLCDDHYRPSNSQRVGAYTRDKTTYAGT